ncbi:hypothetical protein FRC07_013314 [Ceratobasidium sp. 392]|nr:hypothetical protein FRC07_013314 [Ceratobasidium sp. 392]
MAALLALGYSMLVDAQKANDTDPPTGDQQPTSTASTNSAPLADEAAPTWAGALSAMFTPEAGATPNPSTSGATPSQSSVTPTPPASPPLQGKPSALKRSFTKNDSNGDATRSGSSRRQKMHASGKDLDEQYAKQMAKVARLMRKMARAEQREKNARWKAAMKDITMARAAGIDPQTDKVGWDEDSDDEDVEHADATLKKPVTNLSAKTADSDVPAPESGDTLARFIHAMFTNMNPFEDAPHVERDGKPVVPTPPPSDSQPKDPAPKADQGADTEVLRLLSSASAMNQETRSRGSVWNFLDRLTPGRPKKGGAEAADGSVMFSAPLFITENSKVEVARSEMRRVEEEHESDLEDAKPQSSKFVNLVTRMGMDGMFGKKKSGEEKAEESEASVVEAKAEPVAPAVKEMRVWRPSPDNISLQCSWWGYRIYLPPPVLAVLSDQKLEAASRAALVTSSLQWMIDHVPTALLPPQVGLVMSLIRGIIPALGYIGGFIAWSWNAISGADKGDGVVLSATWLLPIALIPGPWDIPPEPVQPIEPEPVATVKTKRPSISRTPSLAKMLPSLERKASTRSSTSKSEKKAKDKETTETKPVPIKRPTEPARRPSAAGPLPTPPSSFPRSATHLASPPPLMKSREPSQDSERPTLKRSTSKLGLNIVWSDKPQTEEPESTETGTLKRKASFKLPMPDVTWDHERKAAEAEAAAKLQAEQEAKAVAKAKLKNKYAQALQNEMNAEKAPNKENRAKARETATLKKDTSGIETEIQELEDLGETKLDQKQSARLKELRAEVERVRKIKQDYVNAHPEQAHLVRGLQGPRRKQEPNPSSSGALPAVRSIFGKNGLPIHPERSLYYDPVMNPYGMPPPGMPYAERPLLAHEIEEDQRQSQVMSNDAGADVDAEMSDGGEESNSDEADSSDEDIALPAGPPPDGIKGNSSDSDSDSEDSDDDIPMPPGPPPPKSAPPLPLGPPPSMPPFPAGAPFVTPFPPFPPAFSAYPNPPNIPPPPPGLPMAMGPQPIYAPPFAQASVPYLPQTSGPGRGPRAPRDRQYMEAARVVQDPLSDVPHITFQAHQAQRHQAPPISSQSSAGLPAKPSSTPHTTASATVFAEPELRDLKKEATAFVPASMRRAAKKGPSNNATVGLQIDAAPGEKDNDGPPAEPRKDLVSTLGSQLGVGSEPITSSKNNQVGQGKDDYDKFLAEVGSFL